MTTAPDRALRVLHITWSMGIGGIENYLMAMARRLRSVRMDFVVHSDVQGFHEPEIAALGGRVFRLPPIHLRPDRLARYVRRLDAALQAGGPYDIVHCHYDVSGVSLWRAARAGVQARIAHAYNTVPELRFRAAWLRAALLPLTQGLLHRYATMGFAISAPCAAAKFGPRWAEDGRWILTPAVAEMRRPSPVADRRRWKANLGIPEDALVLANVARFGPAKNHPFLLEMAVALKQRGIPFRLLLIGDGPIRGRLEATARRRGVGQEVLFLGFQPDLASWMDGAIDALVFPSVHEGLLLAMVLGEAAGIPVLASDVVPPDGVLIPELVTFFPLSASAADWAHAAVRLARSVRPLSPDRAWAIVEKSPFNADRAAETLESFYRRAVSADLDRPYHP